jgi:RNA polymerase sigma-70 factor (ECF subfamily)
LSRTALAKMILKPSKLVLDAEEDFLLIKAIADGNENAFGEMYCRYQQPIYNYLLRTIQDDAGADDILQEVFLAVWQGAGKFRQKSTVKTWIYRIAYKQSISWLRKHHQKPHLRELEEVVDGSEGPEETAMVTIRNAQLKRAMTGLGPKHRAVLDLAFVQDMSYTEIAAILDCPIGTVKSRMSYALHHLSQILVKIGIDAWENTGKEK